MEIENSCYNIIHFKAVIKQDICSDNTVPLGSARSKEARLLQKIFYYFNAHFLETYCKCRIARVHQTIICHKYSEKILSTQQSSFRTSTDIAKSQIQQSVVESQARSLKNQQNLKILMNLVIKNLIRMKQTCIILKLIYLFTQLTKIVFLYILIFQFSI